MSNCLEVNVYLAHFNIEILTWDNGGKVILSISTIHLDITRDSTRLIGAEMGSGHDTLLLHAGGESSSVWHPVMECLAMHGFRSIAYDQRGHGNSEGSTEDSVLAFASDAIAMIKPLNKPVVVGGSLGGFALMLALEEVQEDVAGLVLVDVTPSPDPILTRKFLSSRGELGTSSLVEDILSRSEQLSQIVASFELPILLICGGTRSPIDENARTSFKEMVPDITIEMIDEAGHLVARDAPQKLSKHLISFMGRPEILARRSFSLED